MTFPTKSPIRTFAPIRTRRAFEIICEQVRDELASGRLRPGDKLPPERELARQFGVSRTALREALRSLEVAGVIRNVKGARGGSFVQSAEPDRIAQALQDYVSLGDITLDELTEARLAMQDIVVRLACERGLDADFDELLAIAERTAAVSDVEARYQCAVDYYAVLARATGNRLFALFVDSLSSVMQQFVRGPGYETLQDTLIDSWLRLVAQLRARDCDAAVQEMRAHLGRVHQHVRHNLDGRALTAIIAGRPVDGGAGAT